MSVPSYPRHLTDWVARGLEALLGFSDDQMVAHLLSFSKKQALSEHTQDFLGANRAVEEFTSELWRRKTGEKDTTGPSAAQRVTGGGGSAAQQAERKQPESSPAKPQQREADLYGSATNTSSAAIKQKAQQQQQIDALGLGKNVRVKHQAAKRGGGGGDPLQPAGRAPCHCQATTHALFTNCTACGKIVCEQEGEGPCFFCGSMVTAAGTFPNDDFVAWMESMESKDLVQRQEENAAKRGAKKGEPAEASSSSTPAMEAAARESEAAGLAKAETQRDKLLQYATEKKGSKIYDDQNDWYEFESNRWLTQEARDAKKKETEQQLLNLERRKAHTLTLDIENKQIITHSSDAWKESLQPEPAGKWTDASEPSLIDNHFTPAPAFSHGAAMAQAVAGSKQLQTLVDEMRIISQKQYFANDTLSGRAAEVYRDLRQSLRAAASSASISASSSIATPASSSALVSSLGKSTHSRGGHFADLSTHEVVGIGVEGLEEAMNELQLEEHLAQARRAQEEKEQKAACAMAEDEDEPTNCGGALEPRPSVFSDDSDRGVCLSMWQPWASLLVLGIKRFEGRGWYTPYRGRLWIASGSRETTPEEIQQVEDEYRAVYGPNAKIPFPADYPTSALLGCVDLTHCWSAEEFQAYRSNHGAGGEDSASAFVFVCSNPRTLPLPQSHSGQHKLYNLPPKLYQSIGPNLKPVSEQWRLQLTSQKEAETAGFDIWPATIRPAGASSSAALQAVKPTIQVLQPGMLLLKSALSLPVQQAIVDCIRHIGLLGSCTGFTTPQYKDGPQMNLKMLCLGMYWDLNTKKWQQRNAQGKTQYPIPATLLEEVDKMLTIAVDYLQSRGAGSKFPHYKPDLAIVNYYSASSGKLGVHQDKDESRESITAGYPVVSFSIGDSCDFVYGNQRIPDEKLNLPGGQAYSKVTLASGDVLLFGGPSRSIFHGVESIKGGTAPRGLFFKQGRLNITFRKM